MSNKQNKKKKSFRNHMVSAFLFMAVTCSLAQSDAEYRKKSFSKNDTIAIDGLLDLGKFYYVNYGKGDSLIVCAKKALLKSKEIKDTKRIITCQIYIGTAYMAMEDYAKAEKEWIIGSELAVKAKFTDRAAELNNKLGALCFNLGQTEKSIQYFILAAKDAEKLKDYDLMCNSYYGISSVYAIMDQDKKRMQYIRKALKLIKNFPVKENNQDIILSSAAQHYFEIGNHDRRFQDSAQFFAEKGLAIAMKNGWDHRKPTYLSVLSAIAFQKKDYELSEKYCQETLVLLGSHDALSTKFSIFSRLAKIYGKRNNKPLAYQYIDSLLGLKWVEQDYYAANAYREAYEMYIQFGDETRALHALEKQLFFEKKVLESGKTKSINELETKYRTELKDGEILQLNQQKKIDALEISQKNAQLAWLFGALGIIGLLLLTIVFYTRQRGLKNKQQIMETEQRLNRARMDPHFFFNALSSIQTLALSEQSPKTVNLLSKFSKIMRQSLESTYKEMVTIEEDILFLTKYMELQQLRHPNKFGFQMKHDDDLEIFDILIPSMLFQPFIENSIEHGFKNTANGGLIEIYYYQDGENLCCDIMDNGKVENELKLQGDNHQSRAMQIIHDRLFILQKQTGKKAFYKVENSPESMGYKVKVTLPLIYKNESINS